MDPNTLVATTCQQLSDLMEQVRLVGAGSSEATEELPLPANSGSNSNSLASHEPSTQLTVSDPELRKVLLNLIGLQGKLRATSFEVQSTEKLDEALIAQTVDTIYSIDSKWEYLILKQLGEERAADVDVTAAIAKGKSLLGSMLETWCKLDPRILHERLVRAEQCQMRPEDRLFLNYAEEQAQSTPKPPPDDLFAFLTRTCIDDIQEFKEKMQAVGVCDTSEACLEAGQACLKLFKEMHQIVALTGVDYRSPPLWETEIQTQNESISVWEALTRTGDVDPMLWKRLNSSAATWRDKILPGVMKPSGSEADENPLTILFQPI